MYKFKIKGNKQLINKVFQVELHHRPFLKINLYKIKMIQDYYLHLKEHNKKGLNNKNPKEEKEDHLVLKTKINDFFK